MLLGNEICLPVFRSVDQCICLSKTEVALYNRMSCPERKGKVRMEFSRAYPSVNDCEPKQSYSSRSIPNHNPSVLLQGPAWHYIGLTLVTVSIYTLKPSDIITSTYFMGRINIQAWLLNLACVVLFIYFF